MTVILDYWDLVEFIFIISKSCYDVEYSENVLKKNIFFNFYGNVCVYVNICV